MNLLGNLALTGGGVIKKLRPENLAADPVSPLVSQIWFNTVDLALKYFDGTEVHQIAQGGDLDEYLRRDGSLQMGADLELSSVDQTASTDLSAVSKGHLNTELDKKELVLTGAATTIAHDDLDADLALVSDAAGKVSASATTSAQVGYLSTLTSDVQVQLDSKEDALGYTPLDKAGDAMSGQLAMNTNAIVGLPAAVDATSPVRLAEFDGFIAGFNWQEDVIAIQTDALTDPGAAPEEGARYVISDAANLHANFGTIADVENNDIVEFDGTDFVVTFDANVVTDPDGAMVWNTGAANNYRLISDVWTPFYGLDNLIAGTGLIKSGQTFDVNLGAGIGETPFDEVGIDYAPNGGLWTQVAGVESTDSASTLAIKLNGSSLKTTVLGLEINADGIDETMLVSSALGNGLQGGSGVTLNVKGDTGITVSETGVAFDETYGDERYATLSGATFTGIIKGVTPVDDEDLSTKGYIDTADALINEAITALSTKVGGGHFVYEEVTTPASSHVVVHNFANKYVDVTVVDTSDEVILPDSISYTDDNTVTVGFTSPILCRVIITGANKS